MCVVITTNVEWYDDDDDDNDNDVFVVFVKV